MTDHELLELAAKAHGGVTFDQYREVFRRVIEMGFLGEEWSPLTSGDDSQELAVRLNLSIYDFGSWFAISWLGHPKEVEEEAGPDRDASLRRAIVRAAAEVGRAMQ